MGRFAGVVLVVFFAGLLSSCSHTQSVTTTTSSPVPAHLTLSPSPSASLEIGKTLSFIGTPTDATSTAISETVSYLSSDPSVLTITTSGLACAGSWDSLTTPQICTPGPPGVAQVTATVSGVSSPATTVYVHQHIDNVILSPAPNQIPAAACVSSGQSFNYQATAYDRAGGPAPGLDVTSTVGPFLWASTNTSVVTLTAATPTSPQNGLLPGQATAKANVPGTTMMYASVDGVTSVPLQFNTCAVESIALEINGTAPGPLNLPVGTPQTVTTVITDTLGTLITGSFLTWTSSNSSSVAVTSAGAVSTPQRGGASVIASCTPPSCNIGTSPTLPIYPENAVQVVVSPAASGTAAAATSTAWASTTGCKGTDGCVSGIASVTNSTTPPSATNPVTLPATPNSMLMDRQGAKIYLGTDSGQLGTKGLMVFTVSGSTVAEYISTPGKVLAVSPDGTKVIVSDTVDTPNQVFVFDSSSTTSVAYLITGATAAAFSPDSLKAYIVAGSTLYVYSKLDALQTISLAAPASGVTFFPEGAFAYIAGEQASAVTVRKTCDNTIANSFPSAGTPTPAAQVLPVPATPIFIQSLPSSTVLAADSTGLDFITAAPMSPLDPVTTSTGTNLTGCAPPTGTLPSGLPAISNTVSTTNLGQGNLALTQLLVSSDGSTAYLLTQNSGRILVYNLQQRSLSFLQLAGGSAALHATLSPDAGTLYVGASDATVHLLDTLTGNDTIQIPFPQNLNALQTGLCANVAFTCNPDLIVSSQ